MILHGERVLDASVMLAALRIEPSSLNLGELLNGAVMSAVNVSEVWAKATEYGLADDPSLPRLLSLLVRIVPFTTRDARITANLREQTWKSGLGLGDRACLALGIRLKCPVYTAENVWRSLSVGCEIIHIR